MLKSTDLRWLEIGHADDIARIIDEDRLDGRDSQETAARIALMIDDEATERDSSEDTSCSDCSNAEDALTDAAWIMGNALRDLEGVDIPEDARSQLTEVYDILYWKQ